MLHLFITLIFPGKCQAPQWPYVKVTQWLSTSKITFKQKPLACTSTVSFLIHHLFNNSKSLSFNGWGVFSFVWRNNSIHSPINETKIFDYLRHKDYAASLAVKIKMKYFHVHENTSFRYLSITQLKASVKPSVIKKHQFCWSGVRTDAELCIFTIFTNFETFYVVQTIFSYFHPWSLLELLELDSIYQLT